jgi:hypothetical protein
LLSLAGIPQGSQFGEEQRRENFALLIHTTDLIVQVRDGTVLADPLKQWTYHVGIVANGVCHHSGDLIQFLDQTPDFTMK